MKLSKIIFLFFIISVKLNAQQVKDFTLNSVTDKSSFILSQAKGKFIAIHFLLKTECPYCLKLTNEYFEKSNTLMDVIQVFVKPDSEEEIKEWANELKSKNTIPIYQDKDAKLADLFNVPFGFQFHGQVVHYPALILLDKEGNEVFRYIGKNNTDRYPLEKLREKINKLNQH